MYTFRARGNASSLLTTYWSESTGIIEMIVVERPRAMGV